MSVEDDPYRPPEARIAEALFAGDHAQETCWRHGHLVATLRAATLPPRCIKCNADAADGMRVRRYSWVRKRVYLFLLLIPAGLGVAAVTKFFWAMPIGVILGFGFALIANIRLRQRTRQAVGLCARHRRIRRRVLGAAAAVSLLAVLSPWSPLWPLAGPALPLILLGVAIAIASSSAAITLSPVWMDRNYACYANCDEAFLASLPELPEAMRAPPADASSEQ
jgi:hypothetical protein